jgi:hypothetical protein
MQQLPEIPYADWVETRTSLHQFAQIVGKVRMANMPRRNHWWHVPLYVSARGLTTRTIPSPKGPLELEFDFPDAHLSIRGGKNEERRVALQDTSVARFLEEVLGGLEDLGHPTRILAQPFDPSKVGTDVPFAKSTGPAPWDGDAVHRFWKALTFVDRAFERSGDSFLGKVSPIHFFWHSFDLAVTRFSGKLVPVAPEADPVTREAYNREVISAGFWPGDSQTPEACFYAYAAPEPQGLAEEPLAPETAWWQDLGGSHMALLRYEDVRKAPDPEAAVMEFVQSTYEAGAKRGAWPRTEIERS